jgi:hypothetical protein
MLPEVCRVSGPSFTTRVLVVRAAVLHLDLRVGYAICPRGVSTRPIRKDGCSGSLRAFLRPGVPRPSSPVSGRWRPSSTRHGEVRGVVVHRARPVRMGGSTCVLCKRGRSRLESVRASSGCSNNLGTTTGHASPASTAYVRFGLTVISSVPGRPLATRPAHRAALGSGALKAGPGISGRPHAAFRLVPPALSDPPPGRSIAPDVTSGLNAIPPGNTANSAPRGGPAGLWDGRAVIPRSVED